MPRDIDVGSKSEAFEIASMRYSVDPARSDRLGDRMAELDSVYETEIKRLTSLVATAKKKLFGSRDTGID